MLRLFKVTQLGVRQIPDKKARVGKGLEKRLQGMLRSITVIQKTNQFKLGYKPDRRGQQRFMEEKRDKRIVSCLKKEKESVEMEILSLSHTFRSACFINPEAVWSKDKEMSTDVYEAFGSLSIDMVEVRDQETRGTGLPPFPHRQIFGQLDRSRTSHCL